MKLKEAIEILDTHSKASYSFHSPDFWDALKLGIEALKEIERLRKFRVGFWKVILPGETTEKE